MTFTYYLSKFIDGLYSELQLVLYFPRPQITCVRGHNLYRGQTRRTEKQEAGVDVFVFRLGNKR